MNRVPVHVMMWPLSVEGDDMHAGYIACGKCNGVIKIDCSRKITVDEIVCAIRDHQTKCRAW